MGVTDTKDTVPLNLKIIIYNGFHFFLLLGKTWLKSISKPIVLTKTLAGDKCCSVKIFTFPSQKGRLFNRWVEQSNTLLRQIPHKE